MANTQQGVPLLLRKWPIIFFKFFCLKMGYSGAFWSTAFKVNVPATKKPTNQIES